MGFEAAVALQAQRQTVPATGLPRPDERSDPGLHARRLEEVPGTPGLQRTPVDGPGGNPSVHHECRNVCMEQQVPGDTTEQQLAGTRMTEAAYSQ